MNDSFSILFYPKRSDANKRGQAHLYMRITVDGRRTELSIRRKVDIAKWDTSKEKMRGNTPELREVNSHMSNIRMRILKLYDKLIDEGRYVTAVMLKDTYLEKKGTGKNVVRGFSGT